MFYFTSSFWFVYYHTWETLLNLLFIFTIQVHTMTISLCTVLFCNYSKMNKLSDASCLRFLQLDKRIMAYFIKGADITSVVPS